MHLQLEEERKQEWLEQNEDTVGKRSLDISGMGLGKPRTRPFLMTGSLNILARYH
jgi:hypothetical protein